MADMSSMSDQLLHSMRKGSNDPYSKELISRINKSVVSSGELERQRMAAEVLRNRPKDGAGLAPAQEGTRNTLKKDDY